MLVSMAKLNDFVRCNDMQQGMVVYKRKDLTCDYAVTVKGSFSWGIKIDKPKVGAD